jgi:hypothetical protein
MRQLFKLEETDESAWLVHVCDEILGRSLSASMALTVL